MVKVLMNNKILPSVIWWSRKTKARNTWDLLNETEHYSTPTSMFVYYTIINVKVFKVFLYGSQKVFCDFTVNNPNGLLSSSS